VLAELREKFFDWKEQLLPKHPMAEAIKYALGHWEELNVFLADGAVAIDNNVFEREMKRVVLTRMNSLFVGNTRGGRTAASCPALPPAAAATTWIHNSTSPNCWSTCLHCASVTFCLATLPLESRAESPAERLARSESLT
jgi:transposase IS66 family protein